ncbi:protein CNPPD1-like [Lytechinus variegatus]|uniref:protein CNPPD1-like n=1 Tax=Lytechinus variegatus TaxID=7654 RepID=UPI001BB1CC8E|nr:protein CNPPD1-like [Lytechinus variegatus]
MEFLESLRRLEEDVENYSDFEQLPVHNALERRFRNTLYLGKSTEGISLPVADVAVDLFQNAAEKNLGTFTRRHVAKFNRNGQINPSSSMLGMMYARRLKRQKSSYLQKVTSTELFLVSMMLATKFLYDEGEDEEIFSDEWADSAKIDVKRVNELERDFLEAIDWDLYIKPDEFFEFLQQMETWIALNEGRRRGWFSYSDFNVLMEHKDWYTTISQLLDQSLKVIGMCLAAYSLCSAIVCWSVLLMQHHSAVPGMAPASDNYSHVFHGVRPLKATQVSSHQSEIMLPPPNVVHSASDQSSAPSEMSPCPNCRQCCCNLDQGHLDSQSVADGNTSPCHLQGNEKQEPLSCQQCLTRGFRDDYWLRTKVDDVGQALISFYHALLVAYHDTSAILSNNSDPGSPMKSRSHQINHSATQGQLLTPTPSEYLPDVNCPLLSRRKGMKNPRDLNMDSDSNLASKKQCSVCDGMAKRKTLQERIHTLLPKSIMETAVPATTGTIPLIVA